MPVSAEEEKRMVHEAVLTAEQMVDDLVILYATWQAFVGRMRIDASPFRIKTKKDMLEARYWQKRQDIEALLGRALVDKMKKEAENG